MAVRRDSAALQAKGIRFDTLICLIPDIERLATVRNQGAHAGEKIDRERASVLFGDWFENGLLKELFAAILPTA